MHLPNLCRTKHVGVREAATEYYHVDVFECLAAGDEVGHHNVLNVEACKIERVCHLTLAVCTLLTDDSSLDARRCATVGRYSVAIE